MLVIPTSDIPPKLGAKEILSEEYLIQTSCLTSLASMSGCCQVKVPHFSPPTHASFTRHIIRSQTGFLFSLQVSLPVGVHDKCPVSLSLLARHGGDRFLLDTLQTIYASLQEQVDTAAKPKSSSKGVTQETTAEMAKEKVNSKNISLGFKFYNATLFYILCALLS